MKLRDYIDGNPFSGTISFSVWNARRRRAEEGFFGNADLRDALFQRYSDYTVRKVERTEKGWLVLEVSKNDGVSGKPSSKEKPQMCMDCAVQIKKEKEDCFVENLDEVTAELCNACELVSYEITADDAENEIISVDGIRVVIPALHVSMRQGEVCIYDPEEERYMADYSVTILYEENETDPQRYLYWEQNGFQVALFNFFRNDDFSMNELGELKCIVEIEQEAPVAFSESSPGGEE